MRSCRLESARTNRMLMRRYALVEKAKDADVIGILVGTLGVGTFSLGSSATPTVERSLTSSGHSLAAYLPLITHLRQLIASHHKKSYTVAVGKLNPAKLANFIEVECFVLVACPENTMVDSKVRRAPSVHSSSCRVVLTFSLRVGIPSTDCHPVRARARPDLEGLDRAVHPRLWRAALFVYFRSRPGSDCRCGRRSRQRGRCRR